MMRYSVQPRDRKFEKGYGFFSFAKDMGKTIGKHLSNNQKLFDHNKQSARDALKTASIRATQKTAEAI